VELAEIDRSIDLKLLPIALVIFVWSYEACTREDLVVQFMQPLQPQGDCEAEGFLLGGPAESGACAGLVDTEYYDRRGPQIM